jgi:hypothetical protein
VENPKITRYENMLMAMPRDFKELATWAWTDLRKQLYKHAVNCGATPALAHVLAARLSKLIVTQMYGDIKRDQQLTPRVHQ